MSHFSSVTVTYKDVNCLVDALIACGFTKDQIEVYDTPAQLFDFRGRPTQYVYKDTGDARFQAGDVAHVIVRRRHLGTAHNDLGFFVDTKGDSRELLCDFARRVGAKGAANPIAKADGGYAPWLTRVKREYAVKVFEKQCKRQGKKAVRVNGKDGKIRLYAKA